jgi:transcriptional regulator with XRE-family HTH domain
MTTARFGARVKDLREGRGFSMQYVASELGRLLEKTYYASFVQRVENGDSIPPERVIRALATILGKEADALLDLARAEDTRAVESEREDPATNRLGRAVRHARLRKGLSQRQLADAVSSGGGVTLTFPSVSGIERGAFIPSIQVIKRLASVLEENSETLLELAGKFDGRVLQGRAQADPRIARLLTFLSAGKITEQQLQAITAILELEQNT